MTRKHILSLAVAAAVLVIAPMQTSAQDRYGAWRDESGDLPGFSDPAVLLIGTAVVVGAYLVWRLVRNDSSEADENETVRAQAFDDPVGALPPWPTDRGAWRTAPRGDGAERPIPADCRTQPLVCLELSRPTPIRASAVAR